MTKRKSILIAAAAALALTTGAASAQDTHHDRVAHHDFDRGAARHDIDRGRIEGRAMIARDRVYDVFRVNHVRFVGAPYLYNGYYVAQCYDAYGRLEYCRVDPYTGAFVGFTFRL